MKKVIIRPVPGAGRNGGARAEVRRPGQDPADGLEQLEQVRLQRERTDDPRDRRRHGVERHEGRRLPLREHRRLLAWRARREGFHPPARRAFSVRHEGAGGLRAFEGPEVGHLFGCGLENLRRQARQPRLRIPGRADVRGVGHRLPQVRLVRHQRPQGRRRVSHHARSAAQGGQAGAVLAVRVGRQPALGLGEARRAIRGAPPATSGTASTA